MAVLGIPSGVVVQRLGSRTTMLVADFARAPILASIPLLHSAGVLSFGLLLGLVALLGCFMPPYFASQRTILPELVGEDERRMSQANSSIEGGSALAAHARPCDRRAADPVHRRAERPVRRRGDVPGRVPARARLRPAAKARHRGGSARRPRRTSLPARRTGCSRRWRRWSSPSASSARACRRVCPCTPTTSSTEAPGSRASSTRPSGPERWSAASSRSFAVQRIPPLRLAAFGILAFSIPMWVLPFLPPWPVVFVALFAAMLFTPLVNGPTLGRPDGSDAGGPAAEGHDRRDLGEHARCAARASSSRARCSSTGASSRSSRRSSWGSRGWRSCSPPSSGGTTTARSCLSRWRRPDQRGQDRADKKPVAAELGTRRADRERAAEIVREPDVEHLARPLREP